MQARLRAARPGLRRRRARPAGARARATSRPATPTSSAARSAAARHSCTSSWCSGRCPGSGAPRPGSRGLYLASASAHPGGGVHGACGSNAARAALLHDRVRRLTPARRSSRALSTRSSPTSNSSREVVAGLEHHLGRHLDEVGVRPVAHPPASTRPPARRPRASSKGSDASGSRSRRRRRRAAAYAWPAARTSKAAGAQRADASRRAGAGSPAPASSATRAAGPPTGGGAAPPGRTRRDGGPRLRQSPPGAGRSISAKTRSTMPSRISSLFATWW